MASESHDAPSESERFDRASEHRLEPDDHLSESFALDESLEPSDGLVDMQPAPSPEPRPRREPEPPTTSADAPPASVDASAADPAPVDPVPAEAATPSGRRKKKSRGKSPWWELPLLIAIAVVVAMLIKTFLVQPFYIPSESMEKTLHGCTGCAGDRILVNKPIYHLRDPHPGDIVVFKAPDGWDNEPVPSGPSNPVLKAVHWVGQLVGLVPPNENDLVKRVIAIGGQTVKGDADGSVEVADSPDGPFHKLVEPYVFQNVSGSDATFGPVTIPKGRLWVMGDHRAVSADSRYHFLTNDKGNVVPSTVPVSSVIGKAVLIVWPPSRWRTLGTPATFKQLALGVGGTAAPTAGGLAVVFPIFLLRRRRRRT
jgi:signal peptidase I